jgi:propionyl-CoA carboxylase alpha chain
VRCGWRNNPTQPQRTVFDGATVSYVLGTDGLLGSVDDEPVDAELVATEVLTADLVRVVLRSAGLAVPVDVRVVGDRSFSDSTFGSSTFVEQPRFPTPGSALAPGSLTASMPGTVTRVAVTEGDEVVAGQLVVVLEAMKMEHPLTAPTDGVVTALHVEVGQQVETGTALAVVAAAAEPASEGAPDAS